MTDKQSELFNLIDSLVIINKMSVLTAARLKREVVGDSKAVDKLFAQLNNTEEKKRMFSHRS